MSYKLFLWTQIKRIYAEGGF